jgi:hypothetical protein
MKYDLKHDPKHEGMLRKTRFNTVSIIRAHSCSESRSIMSVCLIAPANKLPPTTSQDRYLETR